MKDEEEANGSKEIPIESILTSQQRLLVVSTDQSRASLSAEERARRDIP